MHTYRYATKEKIQLVKDVEEFDRVIKVRLLTFSRNFIVFEFDKKTFDLISQENFKSHTFSFLVEKLNEININLSEKLVELETF